jgi:hypothetical protein
MHKVVKGLVEIGAGVSIGIALFLAASLPSNPSAEAPGWGYPFVWHVMGTGLKVPGSFLGVYLGVVNSVALAIDLVFWMILSMAAVELSSHLAIPYVRRRLKIHRSKRSTATTLPTNLIQTPDAPE